MELQWPYGSGAPGFGIYYGKKWYNSDSEEQDEHDDPPLPATTSNTRSFPVPKYRDRPRVAEPSSDSKLPGPIKDNKSPEGDIEHLGTGKMSSEPESPELQDHFDFRPDTSSSGSNPADYEPIPNERNRVYALMPFHGKFSRYPAISAVIFFFTSRYVYRVSL